MSAATRRSTIAALATQRSDSARKSRSAAGNSGLEPVSSCDQLVGRDADVERSVASRLLEEPNVLRPEVVQARLHDHGRRGRSRVRGLAVQVARHEVHGHEVRTATGKDPGGASSDATTR